MTVSMTELTWMEYDETVKSRNPVVFLTVGSHEQHGPHLPMCCDVAIPDGIAKAVAERVDGLVAPAVVYGYKSQARSGGGNHIPGTISLDAVNLIGTVKDVLCELAKHGIRRIVIMDGHYENTMLIIEGIDLALRDLRRDGVRDIKILRIGYYEFTTPEVSKVVWPDGFPTWPLEHAGVMETSVMMHLHPELVHVDRIPDHGPAEFPPYDVFPETWENLPGLPRSGALMSSRTASAEKGKILFDTYVNGITAAVQKEFGSGIKRKG
jgi:creatinine amidohydrolase